jgi:hypothetical protein
MHTHNPQPLSYLRSGEQQRCEGKAHERTTKPSHGMQFLYYLQFLGGKKHKCLPCIKN